MIKRIIFIILLIFLIVNFAYRIDLKKSPHELIGELMYFPSGIALKALSLGLYAPLSDLVWLRFIQYYGEHRLTDRKFEYMYHILDILTTLDSKFIYAYTLGGLMLTHDAKKPIEAKRLLRKGMTEHPDEWRTPFIYAFIHYVFLKDYHVAQTYFRLSAQKPNAPDFPKRWAAFTTYKKLGDLKTSLALWIDLYKTTENPEEKEIAELYVHSLKMKLDIEFLNKKIDEFEKSFGREPLALDELVIYGIIEVIPPEPHGKDYKYAIKDGKAFSTWKIRDGKELLIF
jgi:hypothetical protein